MTMAHAAWDLAAQSQGRFILGLGTQVKAHIERRFGMPWPESVTGKLREQIEAMRAIWNSWQNYDRLNYRGEYYKLTLMSPFFNPGPLPPFPDRGGVGGEVIPIYIAGVNTGLAKLAGELCNGFLVHPLNTAKYLREVIVPAIEEGAAKKDRKRKDIDISVSAFAASTPEEKEFCRQQVSFYASTPSYRAVMELHGWNDIAEKLSAHAARGEWGDMPALISDDILREFMVESASPSELAAAIKERYNGIGDRVSLYIPFVPGQKDDWWRELLRAF
jgi:probable F420-dependent oxidoreductase